MRKRIIETLILICVVSAFGLGMTNTNKTTNNNKTEIISNIEDYNLSAGVSGDIANMLESAQDTPVAIKEKRFEEYNMYTNCCVNVREEGDLNSTAITTLDPNTLVKIISEGQGWNEIELGEEIHGYIKKDYLSADETPILKLNRWGIELTNDEIDLLALIVNKEAGTESMTGKEAVVEVVFNRMVSDTFGGDLYHVLSEHGQFTTWTSRYNATPSEEEYQAIYNVLYGKTYILDYTYVYFSRGKVNGYDFIPIGRHWFSKGKIYE